MITLTDRSQIAIPLVSIEEMPGIAMMEILKVQNVKKISDYSYFKSLTKVLYYPHCNFLKIESFEFDKNIVDRGVVLVEIVDLHSRIPSQSMRWYREGIDAIAAEENWGLLSNLLHLDFRNYIIRQRRTNLVRKIKNKLNIG
jgi:hypothetical protein